MNQCAKKDFSDPSGHRERLRARYAGGGISALSDYEVVEFLLTLAIPRSDVKPSAKMLIAKFGNLKNILDAPTSELTSVKGIGNSAALSIKFARDLVALYCQDEVSEAKTPVETIHKLINFFRARLDGKANEALDLVCFDPQLRILKNGVIRIFEGSVNSASVDIRRIVETALSLGATNIAIAHNHPSGNPKPSYDDILFTSRLSDACRPLHLNLIEHIIVAKGACFSFRRDGHFDKLYDESLLESRIDVRKQRLRKAK